MANIFTELTSENNRTAQELGKEVTPTYKFRIIAKVPKIETVDEVKPYVDSVTFHLWKIERICSFFSSEDRTKPKCVSLGGEKPNLGTNMMSVATCKECVHYYGTPYLKKDKDKEYCMEQYLLYCFDVRQNKEFRLYIKVHKAQSLKAALQKIALEMPKVEDAYKNYVFSVAGIINTKNSTVIPIFNVIQKITTPTTQSTTPIQPVPIAQAQQVVQPVVNPIVKSDTNNGPPF